MGSFTHCIRHINRCARAYREERLGPLGLHGGQAIFSAQDGIFRLKVMIPLK